MPRWNNKIVLAKIETAYGTDAAPTGPANAMLMTNVSLVPMEGEDVSRDLERGYLGAQPTLVTALRARLSGRVELVGSGTAGAAPAWGPLLRACGCAQVVTAGTSVAYNPISDAMESVTLHIWIDGTRHVLRGARGTATFRLAAQGIPTIEFELTGLWSQPGDVARPVPTLTAFQAPQVATTANTPTFTIAGAALPLREFSLDLGNSVEPRLLVGTESIMIAERAERIAARVEAVALATLNPFALAAAATPVAVALSHGTVAGRRAALAVPAAQLQRLGGLEQSQQLVEWPLGLLPLPVNGNDQWTLTLT